MIPRYGSATSTRCPSSLEAAVLAEGVQGDVETLVRVVDHAEVDESLRVAVELVGGGARVGVGVALVFDLLLEDCLPLPEQGMFANALEIPPGVLLAALGDLLRLCVLRRVRADVDVIVMR